MESPSKSANSRALPLPLTRGILLPPLVAMLQADPMLAPPVSALLVQGVSGWALERYFYTAAAVAVQGPKGERKSKKANCMQLQLQTLLQTGDHHCNAAMRKLHACKQALDGGFPLPLAAGAQEP